MGGGYSPKFDPTTGTKILPYRVISSDSHVGEPDDVFTSRVDKKFRDRAIHLETASDGAPWYFCDGRPIWSLAEAGGQAGFKFDPDPKVKAQISGGVGLTFDDVRPGAYDPDARMKDMEIDGIAKEVIYPTVGLVFWQSIVASDLLTAHCRAYNDYIGEFCATHPDKLYGLGTLNLDSIEEAVAELKRCQKMGLVGAMIPSGAPEARPYTLPEYDPLWATAQDLGMPLSWHIGSLRTTPELGAIVVAEKTAGKEPDWLHLYNVWEFSKSMSQVIFGGVFERFPSLQIGCVEVGVSWAVPVLRHFDTTYQDTIAPRNGPNKFKNAMIPSDFWRRNMFIGYQEDELGIQLRNELGVDTIQWGSDYPHLESTFPRSLDVIEENLRDCTATDRAKIAGANCARVFHLDD